MSTGSDLQMVLQVLADTRKVSDHGHAQFGGLQSRAVTDAATLQNLHAADSPFFIARVREKVRGKVRARVRV